AAVLAIGVLSSLVQERTRRAMLRQQREHRLLTRAGSVLASSLDYWDTLSRVAQIVVPGLGDLCIVEIIEDGALRRLKVATHDPGKEWIAAVLMRQPLDRDRPHLAHSVLSARRPLLLRRPSVETIESFAQSEEHRRALRALDIQSLLSVPLVAHGKLLGAMV